MSQTEVFLGVVAIILVALLAIAALESKTLLDKTPHNTITESTRAMTKKHSGLVVILWGLLNLVLGLIAGHIWHAW